MAGCDDIDHFVSSTSRLAIAGTYLLEANSYAGLIVHRTARPVRATEVAHVRLPGDGNEGGGGGHGAFMYGRDLVIARVDGVGMVDVSSPRETLALASVRPDPFFGGETMLSGLVGDTFYLAINQRLEHVRAGAIFSGSPQSLGAIDGVALERVREDLIGNDGVGALHVRWPFAYLIRSAQDPPYGSVAVSPYLEVRDLRNNAVVGMLALPDGVGSGQGSIAYSRDRLYVTRSFSNIAIVNVANPAVPTLVGTVPITGRGALTVSGSRLYATGFGLRIYDITNRDAPVLLGGIDELTGIGVGMTVSSDLLFSGYDGPTSIIDVSDPTDPAYLALPGTTQSSNGAVVSGKHVFVYDNGELSVVALE
jgi:hypothetical protein